MTFSRRLFPGACVCILAALCSAAADWPVPRSNSAQTGVAAESLPEKLAEKWTFKTGDAVEGTSAVVAGVVYIGSTDGHAYALELDTGRSRWKSKTGAIKAPVGFHDDRLYAGNDEGVFYCLNAAKGEVVWKFDAGAEVTSGPAFAAGDVLFGTADEHLHCVGRDGGKARWKFQVPGGPVQGTPVVADGKTYAAGCDSTLHAIDLATGRELASAELGGQVAASASVAGGRLFVGTMSNQVLAVDLKSMKPAWTFQRRQAFYSAVAVTDKLVIIGSRDRKVYAIDRESGQEVWSFATGNKVESGAVVAGPRVYVGSFDRNLYVLELATGREVQKIALDGIPVASPAVSGGRLVLGTDKGTVYCFGGP